MDSVFASLRPSTHLTLKDIVNSDTLPADLALVGVSIASDGSFVETASGQAAREIKKHLDHLYGVGVSVRSPYAITALVNQHGKQMYRVGNRELSAPAAEAQEAEARLSEAQIQVKSADPSSPSRSKRHSRLSMHHIFLPGVFSKPNPPVASTFPTCPITSPPRPDTASSIASGHRKLRKTRSFGPGDQSAYQDQRFVYHQQDHTTQLVSASNSNTFTGRAHSQSVTSADASRYTSLATLIAPSTSQFARSSTTTAVSGPTNMSTLSSSSQVILSPPTLDPSGIFASVSSPPSSLQQVPQIMERPAAPPGDMFAEVMKWGTSNLLRRRTFTNPSTTSFSSIPSVGTTHGTPSGDVSSGSEPVGLDHGGGELHGGFLQHPFGPGVLFDSPVRRTPSRTKRSESNTRSSVSSVNPFPERNDVVMAQMTNTASPGDSGMCSSHLQPPQPPAAGPGRILREMQSFESTMTARQVDVELSTAGGTPVTPLSRSPWNQRFHDLAEEYSDGTSLRRPPSAVLLKDVVPGNQTHTRQNNGSSELKVVVDASSSRTATSTQDSSANVDGLSQPHPLKAIPSDTQHLKSISSDDGGNTKTELDTTPQGIREPSFRYPSVPDIFDVLQTYTGLPLLDRLPTIKQFDAIHGEVGGEQKAKKGGLEDDESDEDVMVETTVIRMSLTTKEETAAPRDDPRFVIWGWVDDGSRPGDDGSARSKQLGGDRKGRSWRGSLVNGSEADGRSDHFGTESSGTGSRKSHRSVGSKKQSKKDKPSEKGKGKAVVDQFGVLSGQDEGADQIRDDESIDSLARCASLEGKKKQLISATIERWVAQLTSDIDYDELFNFFLTYRTYVSATDLCQVLIGRFYWALRDEDHEECGAKKSKVCDERVRRIVRVRTFVAIRYWMLIFWTVDFVPNRELRLLLAERLNQLNKEPLLKKHIDGLGIVKRLIKVAKECRRAHLGTVLEKSPHIGQTSLPTESIASRSIDGNESDVDLDFLPDQQANFSCRSSYAYLNQPGRTSELLPAGVMAPGFALGPMSALGRIVDSASQAPGSRPFENGSYLRAHYQPTQGPLSRVVRTIGKLKRALNVRTASTSVIPGITDNTMNRLDYMGEPEISAFEVEVDMTGDGPSQNLHAVGESYPTSSLPLKIVATPGSESAQPPPVALTGSQDYSLPHVLPPLAMPPFAMPVHDPGNSVQVMPAAQVCDRGRTLTKGGPVSAENDTSTTGSGDSANLPAPLSTESSNATDEASANTNSETVPESLETLEMQKVEGEFELVDSNVEVGTLADVEDSYDATADTETESGRAESLRSTSTNSFGVPLTASRGPPPLFANASSPWGFDIVSIDDLDLSDTSSDEASSVPPGLRKPARKLPKKPLFWPRESVSSMGIISHASIASGPSSSGMSSPAAAGLGGKVEPWQLQDLLKSIRADEEEEGGVDAALKRLEGYIDPQKQEEKLKNVNEWITSIQKRLETGNHDEDPYPAFDEDIIEFDQVDKRSHRESQNSSEELSTPPDTTTGSTTESEPDDSSSPIPRTPERPQMITPMLQKASPVVNIDSPRTTDAKPSAEDAVPFEILNSRVQSFPSPQPAALAFKYPSLPRLHQSFVVQHRAEVLAQHFAMIDRELFMNVRFEELVNSEWNSCQEVNVLDWNQYLKDRARWKAEQRFPEKTSTLAAVRGRFNLMTNFVISEVVLTPPSTRHLVFKKFLIIAYKSYLLYNLHALTAIVTGLSDSLVRRALGRQWSRIGRREQRMFTDFQQFISNVDEFKYMRNMIDPITQAKVPDDSCHTASIVSGSTDGKHKSERKATPHSCIPFIGVYLSQLHKLSKLPDLIDPTAPNLVVGIDPITGTFERPRYPDVFSSLAPLPPSVQLEPLINVHKQRQVAAVIKTLVAGQQLASYVHFEVDKKLFQRCLRLRASDTQTLQHVLARYPD